MLVNQLKQLGIGPPNLLEERRQELRVGLHYLPELLELGLCPQEVEIPAAHLTLIPLIKSLFGLLHGETTLTGWHRCGLLWLLGGRARLRLLLGLRDIGDTLGSEKNCC